MFNKLKTIVQSKKIAAMLAVSAAIPVMAVVASAEDPAPTTDFVTTGINSTVTALSTQLSMALPTVISGLVSIGMFGITIYAVKGLFNLAKNSFAKVGGK